MEIWTLMLWFGLQLRLRTAMSDLPSLVFMLKRTRLGKRWPWGLVTVLLRSKPVTYSPPSGTEMSSLCTCCTTVHSSFPFRFPLTVLWSDLEHLSHRSSWLVDEKQALCEGLATWIVCIGLPIDRKTGNFLVPPISSEWKFVSTPEKYHSEKVPWLRRVYRWSSDVWIEGAYKYQLYIVWKPSFCTRPFIPAGGPNGANMNPSKPAHSAHWPISRSYLALEAIWHLQKGPHWKV